MPAPSSRVLPTGSIHGNPQPRRLRPAGVRGRARLQQFRRRSTSRASRTVVHKAIDLGITLFDTADIYGDRRAARRTCSAQVLGDRRKDIVLATKFGSRWSDAAQAGRLAPLHHDRGRGEPDAAARPTGSTSTSMHRSRSADADRGDVARARRSRPPGQGPLHRLLELSGLAGRRGADGRGRRTQPLRLLPGRIQPRWCAASKRSCCLPHEAHTDWACCRISRWRAAC